MSLPTSNKLRIINQVESIKDGSSSSVNKVQNVIPSEEGHNPQHYKKGCSNVEQASIDGEVVLCGESIDSQGESNCECH